jgi:tripartite-type tricarboxylate transporter receptor subunit TctC
LVGTFALAGVSAGELRTLITAVERTVKDPAVAARMSNLGMVADYEAPDKLIADIRDEHRVVQQIAKKAGLIK